MLLRKNDAPPVICKPQRACGHAHAPALDFLLQKVVLIRTPLCLVSTEKFTGQRNNMRGVHHSSSRWRHALWALPNTLAQKKPELIPHALRCLPPSPAEVRVVLEGQFVVPCIGAALALRNRSPSITCRGTRLEKSPPLPYIKAFLQSRLA